MIKPNCNILITRPAPKGQELANQLTQAGYSALSYPLFSYQASPAFSQHQAALLKGAIDIVVFVSVAAVEFAQFQLAIDTWQTKTIVAVGDATANALTKLNIKAQIPTRFDSEGMLSMPELKDVKDKNIMIIRGDDGRELLADTLIKRGANVSYCQSYQRVWQLPDESTLQSWHKNQITHVVITSVAMLENMVNLLVSPDNYWQKSCVWLVASERIAAQAKCFQLANIEIAPGADNSSLYNAIIAMD